MKNLHIYHPELFRASIRIYSENVPKNNYQDLSSLELYRFSLGASRRIFFTIPPHCQRGSLIFRLMRKGVKPPAKMIPCGCPLLSPTSSTPSACPLEFESPTYVFLGH